MSEQKDGQRNKIEVGKYYHAPFVQKVAYTIGYTVGLTLLVPVILSFFWLVFLILTVFILLLPFGAPYVALLEIWFAPNLDIVKRINGEESNGESDGVEK